MPGGDDGLAAAELLLRVRDHEGDSFARRGEVAQVAGGLGVREVILGVGAGLDEEDLERGIRVREPSRDEAAGRSACSAPSAS